MFETSPILACLLIFFLLYLLPMLCCHILIFIERKTLVLDSNIRKYELCYDDTWTVFKATLLPFSNWMLLIVLIIQVTINILNISSVSLYIMFFLKKYYKLVTGVDYES